MKVTLKELCCLLRDERRGLTELQQQFAKAKATWETERAELKSHTSPVSLPPTETSPLVLSQRSSQLWDLGAGCPSVSASVYLVTSFTHTPGLPLPAVLTLPFLSS